MNKRVDGRVRSVPAAVDQAAFRIVQEALTNVTRHALATTATVSLIYERHRLIVEVTDDGSAAPAIQEPSGKGIAGMGERARALGGDVETGPLPGGGFRVRATLPAVATTEDVP